MSFLYNPDRMTEQEIRDTFVARTALVDTLLQCIERQPDGAGVQHAIITGPRGMGKTTILLMVQFHIARLELSKKWQPIKFPEESYSINDLADLWIEALHLLSAATNDSMLESEVNALSSSGSSIKDLQEHAWALIKDWSATHKKRLVLLIDNFDMIIEQIGDDREKSRLRDILMNDGTVMFIGTAVSFFKESNYDKPFYHFFRLFDLKGLSHEDVVVLLKRRAEIDGIKDFDKKLEESRGRFRALEYFTGGNPRLILMLYRVVTEWGSAEVRKSLEKLLDEVTPFYKSRTEVLPAQQRKILDHIARESAKTFEGLSPSAIAAATRMKVNIVSMQLKRLAEAGYVRSANIKGRSSCFTLSEPLYAIWYQMRFSRTAKERMMWLVSFLKIWFELPQLLEEIKPAKTNVDNICKVNDRQRALYNPTLCENNAMTSLDLSINALSENDMSHALQYLNKARKSEPIIGPEKWISLVLEKLLLRVPIEKLSDMQNFIFKAGLEQEFFPLIRAINYLETGNEELIEKLSPEYRKIVMDVVQVLKERQS